MSRNVTLASVRTVIEAARSGAEEIGVPMCIAVVDDGANLVAFARMDGAWLGSIDIAQDKAFTAAGLRYHDQGDGEIEPARPAALRDHRQQ